MAVNPAGTRVYVVNQGSSSRTVSVLDTATNTVIATVAVGGYPYAFGQFIGPAQPQPSGPICDIQLNNTTFVNGNQVIAQVVRVANPGPVEVPIEVGIWFEVPGIAPIAFANVGADGSVRLAAGFNQNFGPLPPLFTVQPAFPRGTWGFNCRIVSPVTKQLLGEDLNAFTIQ